MKNLIICLIAIMISGSTVIKEKSSTVTPYQVVVETEDGKRFYVPNNLVSIKQEQFDIWFNSPYRGRLKSFVEFKN